MTFHNCHLFSFNFLMLLYSDTRGRGLFDFGIRIVRKPYLGGFSRRYFPPCRRMKLESNVKSYEAVVIPASTDCA